MHQFHRSRIQHSGGIIITSLTYSYTASFNMRLPLIFSECFIFLSRHFQQSVSTIFWFHFILKDRCTDTALTLSFTIDIRRIKYQQKYDSNSDRECLIHLYDVSTSFVVWVEMDVFFITLRHVLSTWREWQLLSQYLTGNMGEINISSQILVIIPLIKTNFEHKTDNKIIEVCNKILFS